MRTRSVLWMVAAALASGGCTAPNVSAQLPLAQASEIASAGVRSSSEVAFMRAGTLSPDGATMRVAVTGAQVTLRQSGAAVTASELTIALADVDLPATDLLPDGLKLRRQHLDLAGPAHATVLERDADTVAVRLHGPFKYSASMVLTDGTLYPIGARDAADDDVDVRAVRDAGGRITVTLDATPAAHDCWSASDLLTLSNCSLYVEADGEARP